MNEGDSIKYLENNVKFDTEETKISCFSVLGNILVIYLNKQVTRSYKIRKREIVLVYHVKLPLAMRNILLL